jgi:hypothetical protein
VVYLEAGGWTAVTAEMDDAGWITLRPYGLDMAGRRWRRCPAFAAERIRLDWPADAISRAVDRIVPRSSREMVLAAIERAATTPGAPSNTRSCGSTCDEGSEAGRRPHGAA